MSNHEVRWFTGRACVGVVHVVDPHDGHEYYIGVGQGYDEQDDILYIAAFGSKFPVDAGNLLFGVSNDRA